MRAGARRSGYTDPLGPRVTANRPPILIERPPYSIFEAGPLAWKESPTSASLTCIEQPLERIDRPHRRLYIFPASRLHGPRSGTLDHPIRPAARSSPHPGTTTKFYLAT